MNLWPWRRGHNANPMEVEVCCPIEKIALQMLIRYVELRVGGCERKWSAVNLFR
jgi:hypothetical protein